MNGKTTTILTAIISSLLGFVIAMLSAYALWASNTVTKDELHNAIKENTPYAQDKAYVHASLTRLETRMVLLDDRMRLLEIAVAKHTDGKGR